MNIYERIREVMREVEYLVKDKKVITNAQKNIGYSAVSEELVTSAVRTSLIKNGIVIIPIKQEHTRQDETVKSEYGEKINRIATVNVTYKIQNVEDKEDYIEAVSSGTGVDTQDKAVGKAMTYAYKYLLLRTFAIPTGEDPDSEKKKKAKEIKDKLVTSKEVQAIRTLLKDKTEDGTNKNISIMLKPFKKEKLESLMMTEYVQMLKNIQELKNKQKKNVEDVF